MLMRWRQLQNERCSVARTMSVIGDRWTMLIVRDCFLGVRRFEVFQQRLAITRHILADRLRKLVKKGVLRKVAYQQRPLRYEYRLSERGLALFPVLMAVVHWGDVYLAGEEGRPIVHEHTTCGHRFDPVMVCSECREVLDARTVIALPGPGAARPRHRSGKPKAGRTAG
jgi:DNA-binding HxlR family transcriptional regulator